MFRLFLGQVVFCKEHFFDFSILNTQSFRFVWRKVNGVNAQLHTIDFTRNCFACTFVSTKHVAFSVFCLFERRKQ